MMSSGLSHSARSLLTGLLTGSTAGGFDPTGRIAFDVTCAQCGHNLRGLLPTGNCGECGLAVQCSLDGGALAAAPLEWLGRVRWGLGLFTLLLPWLWLPLVWPGAALACWCMSTPDHRLGGRAEWMASTARAILLVLIVAATLGAFLIFCGNLPWSTDAVTAVLVTGAVGLLVSGTFAAARLSRNLLLSAPRRILGYACCALTCGLPGVAALAALKLVPSELEICPWAAAAIGILLLLPLPVLLPLGLAWLWREVERAESLARGSETRITIALP